jgi:hypothetical protein
VTSSIHMKDLVQQMITVLCSVIRGILAHPSIRSKKLINVVVVATKRARIRNQK